jgi:hypothetical protein
MKKILLGIFILMTICVNLFSDVKIADYGYRPSLSVLPNYKIALTYVTPSDCLRFVRLNPTGLKVEARNDIAYVTEKVDNASISALKDNSNNSAVFFSRYVAFKDGGLYYMLIDQGGGLVNKVIDIGDTGSCPAIQALDSGDNAIAYYKNEVIILKKIKKTGETIWRQELRWIKSLKNPISITQSSDGNIVVVCKSIHVDRQVFIKLNQETGETLIEPTVCSTKTGSYVSIVGLDNGKFAMATPGAKNKIWINLLSASGVIQKYKELGTKTHSCAIALWPWDNSILIEAHQSNTNSSLWCSVIEKVGEGIKLHQ